jgi:hypothetical protein
VVLACATGAFRSDNNTDGSPNVSTATIQGFFTAGTNNNPAFTSTLSSVFIDGANERAVTPFNASTLSSFMVATTYIGAVRDASDTWYAGWACNSVTASFGSTSAACTAIPTN